MMGSNQYCLKWNYHWKNLVGVFNSLLQSETFVDVTIACEGRRLKAHRLVLSACSPYFTRLLVENPDRHPVIILKGVKYSHLKALIHFIYNGEVAVEQSELPTLISIAREFQIRGLADNTLQEAQLQLAAAQSLNLAEEARNGSDSGASCRLTGTPGAYAVPIDASSSGSAHSNNKNENELHLPLSLVTSSVDQPTDLTSNSSKERNRSRSPVKPPRAPSVDTRLPPHTPPSFDGPSSPSRKKRRVSSDADQNGVGFTSEPENLVTDTNGSSRSRTLTGSLMVSHDGEVCPHFLIYFI